jgi:hypothetical protein
MVAAWSMWLERRVVNCEARGYRASVEAVDKGVLSNATWRVAVWFDEGGCVVLVFLK